MAVNPECPVTGHSGRVDQVAFSRDGAQVVSASEVDDSVRVWDVASGSQVRQLVGDKFVLVEGLSGEHIRDRHVLTTLDDKLLIYEIWNEEQHAEDGAAPVACFKAPELMNSVKCRGATICVGCDEGAVCILSAPFLAA